MVSYGTGIQQKTVSWPLTIHPSQCIGGGWWFTVAQGPVFTLLGALILGLIFYCTLDIEQNEVVAGFNMGTKLVGHASPSVFSWPLGPCSGTIWGGSGKIKNPIEVVRISFFRWWSRVVRITWISLLAFKSSSLCCIMCMSKKSTWQLETLLF